MGGFLGGGGGGVKQEIMAMTMFGNWKSRWGGTTVKFVFVVCFACWVIKKKT